jgi:hypothetical protein
LRKGSQLTDGTDVERYTFASQLSILRSAPTAMARLMKMDGSYLLIAKILVISRLLHKALGQSMNKPPIVDRLWEKLLSMRRKLLRRIDKRLASTTGETASLVESMCAYALVTSSAPSDVLQHFLKVRMDKMVSELKRGDAELAKHGISALKLCIQTCLDTQTIFPPRLAESLAKLKAQPLIQDADIRGLYELNLDVHDRWIGDEARNYTPWPRHDELQRPEAEKLLHRWSKDAVVAFLRCIKKALDGEGRLQEVAHLRQELIETWILSGSRMAGVKSANVLDDLRDTMNEKLESIVRERTSGLQSVFSEVTSKVDNLTVNASSQKWLWRTTAQSSDLSNGAQNFKNTILNSYQGRDQHVNGLTAAFDKWMESVLEVKSIVKNMKEARWDDTFADDVDDESDDDLGDSKQTLLSDDDPRLLEEVTQEALGEALQSFGESFANMVRIKIRDDDGNTIHKAVFVMRIAREISDRIPRLKVQDKSAALASPFQAQTLQDLRLVLTANVTSPTTQAYAASLSKSLKRRSNNHILWEGNPPLPGQPSPSTFRFLKELNSHMSMLGSDIWAPECAAVLKKRVADDMHKILNEHIDAINSTTVIEKDTTEEQTDDSNDTDTAADGEADPSKASQPPANTDVRDRRLKQAVFDALYIQRFVATDDNGKDRLAALAKKVDVSDLDEAAMTRLKKNAADYAKKTYLLFALLA